MTDERRELMLRAMDGCRQLAPLMFHLNSYRQCDEILRYLVSARLTGVNLVQFWMLECQRSFLQVAKEVIRRMEREAEARAVIVGRDFVPTAAVPARRS